MKIITRYLLKELYAAFLIIAAVLLVIFFSNQLIRFLNSVAYGNLSSDLVKLIVFLQLPLLLTILLPASLFLGILISYGRLYADSEMIILFTSGVKPQRLLNLALGFGISVALIVGWLSLSVNPRVYTYFEKVKRGAVSNNLSMIKPNCFNELAGGKWIFYIGQIQDGYYYDVFVAEQATAKAPINVTHSVITAKSAYQQVNKETGDLYLVLCDGYRYLGQPGQKNYEIVKFAKYGIQVAQEEIVSRNDTSSLEFKELWNGRFDKLAAAELQWRLSMPISVLVLVLFAVPLSKTSPAKGKYAKLALGILSYTIYLNLLFLTRAWIKRGLLAAMPGMWWVHGLMLLVALILIGQQLGWRFQRLRFR